MSTLRALLILAIALCLARSTDAGMFANQGVPPSLGYLLLHQGGHILLHQGGAIQCHAC